MDEALEFKNTCKIETPENVLFKIQLLCESALISENKIRFYKKKGSVIIHQIYVLSQIQTKSDIGRLGITLPNLVRS